PGTQFLSHDAAPVPAGMLTTDGKPGVKAIYAKLDMSNMNRPAVSASLATRIEPAIDAAANPLPIEVAGVKPLAIHWEATLTAPATGDYNLGLKADGFFRIRLDGM